MSSVINLSTMRVAAWMLAAAFVAGCSSSSDSVAPSQADIIVADGNNMDAAPGTSVAAPDSAPVITTPAAADDAVTPATPSTPTPSTPTQEDANPDAPLDPVVAPALPNNDPTAMAQITFEITVPVYVSNGLQVQMQVGDELLNASWVRDESWVVTKNFASGTTNEVTVTFSDDNGAIKLARAQSVFTVDAAETTIRVTADQFNRDLFDDDADGVNNFDEVLSGSNPFDSNSPALLQAVQVTLEMVADKTFRLQWVGVGADFYRVLENPDGLSGYVQIGNDLDSATTTYDHRVALYMRADASYIVQACKASTCVDSEAQMVGDNLHEAASVFQADEADFPSDFPQGYFHFQYFGVAVTISGDGNTMAVGVTERKYNDYQNLLWYQGVYVFERIGGQWEKQAYLKPRRDIVDSFFGNAIGLSDDGNTLAIGASGDYSGAAGINSEEEAPSAARSGAAYVFSRVNGDWEEQAYLKASNVDASDRFGGRVSLSGDGKTLAVGARGEDSSAIGVDGLQTNNEAEDSGAVYVFANGDNGWEQQAYIKASNTDEFDSFGSQLALSRDGNVLAVAAYGEASSATVVNGNQNDNTAERAGAVYLYSNSSGAWIQDAFIKASNTDAEDYFGAGLALNADGRLLAVGALWEDSSAIGIDGNQDDNSAALAGATYVYENVAGSWQQQAYIKPNNTDENDYFGNALSFSAKGDVLAVGASGESGSAIGINGNQNDNATGGAGAVYVFKYDGTWQQQAYLKSLVPAEEGSFGSFVSFSADGNSLAVSSTRAEAGAVYLY